MKTGVHDPEIEEYEDDVEHIQLSDNVYITVKSRV
jgi:hypothetical protein